MTTNDQLIKLNLKLPLRTAKALLEFLESFESPQIATSPSMQVTTEQTALELLTRGEKPALVVKTFVKHNGVLFNSDLANALDTASKPQLTFRPLATITLRLRKMGVPDQDWYTKERIDGKTLLRLRPDLGELFKRAAQFAK